MSGLIRYSLDSLPEIERENILAGRLEEMQKFKDSQQLDAMYKMAGMGGDEEEDDYDDEPKKRRESDAYSAHRSTLTQCRETYECIERGHKSDEGPPKQAQSARTENDRACEYSSGLSYRPGGLCSRPHRIGGKEVRKTVLK